MVISISILSSSQVDTVIDPKELSILTSAFY
jgi:hypothetical protein